MIYYIYDASGNVIGLKYNNDIYYYEKNIQNDITGIMDDSFNLLAKYEYDSWGNILSIKDTNGNTITDNTNIALVNPFRYRSYYYDSEIGMYYLNSRYYNQEWGRFINADGTIGANQDAIGNNLYAYVSNNPVNKTDYNGEVAGGSIAIGGAIYGSGAAAAVPLGALGLLGAGAIAVIALAYYGAKTITKAQTRTKVITKPSIKKNDTIIYRYGDTSPSNLTPKAKDIGDGLSFSLIPPKNGVAAVTTVELLEGTGMLSVKKDGIAHYSVVPSPNVGSLAEWINVGSTYKCTYAVKSVVMKWDGKIK